MKNSKRILSILASTGVVMFVFGHGCTGPKNLGEEASLPGDATSLVPSDTGSPTDIVPLPDVKTISMVYSKQIIDHFVGCMGTGKASDRTLAVYDAKAGTITEQGEANTITAPMMMAVSSITGELCQDLINQESAIAISSRRIFTNIDFAAAGLPNNAVLGDAIRRLSRSCWGRNETDGERQILLDSLNQSFPSGTANANGKNAMLFVCTAMMTSLDALTL